MCERERVCVGAEILRIVIFIFLCRSWLFPFVCSCLLCFSRAHPLLLPSLSLFFRLFRLLLCFLLALFPSLLHPCHPLLYSILLLIFFSFFFASASTKSKKTGEVSSRTLRTVARESVRRGTKAAVARALREAAVSMGGKEQVWWWWW